MTASHNPEKLFWKPSGLAAEPAWFGEAADTVDLLVGIWSTKRVKPATQGNSVIVEKDYNRSARLIQCRISCAREPSVMAVGKYCIALQILATASQEQIVMVYDHKEFIIKIYLIQRCIDRAPEHYPAIFSVRADYHRD